jgi:hypothetical protein
VISVLLLIRLFVCRANDAGVYGTRESSSKIKVFQNFKLHKQFRPPFAGTCCCLTLAAGALLNPASASCS